MERSCQLTGQELQVGADTETARQIRIRWVRRVGQSSSGSGSQDARGSHGNTTGKRVVGCHATRARIARGERRVDSLTDLPEGKQAVGSRWVYKTKTGPDGAVVRHKARLVARGFSQKQGADYNETFSPVVRGESVRSVFSLAAQEEMRLDVETAFLNGILQEEVYMIQPEGYEKKGREQQVCRLHKSIYGLKQSPRCWNTVLDEFLKTLKFSQTTGDLCVYVTDTSSGCLIVAVYVDDLVLAGRSQEEIDEDCRRASE